MSGFKAIIKTLMAASLECECCLTVCDARCFAADIAGIRLVKIKGR